MRTVADFQLLDPSPGLEVYVHPTRRWKTTTVRLFLQRPLNQEEASATALLPFVLRRGCQRLPDVPAVTRELDEMYGAQLDADVLKIGERQVIMLSLELVADRYLPVSKGYLQAGIELLGELLLTPLGGTEAFPGRVVREEAEQMARAIESLRDDRVHYAIERCFQEMCAGEPFSVYEYGSADGIRAVTGRSLRQHLDRVLQESVLQAFVVGDVDPEATATTLDRSLRWAREARPLPPTVPGSPPGLVRRVRESRPGGAGELILGHRTGIWPADPLAPALTLMDAMLGGGPSSLLFRRLRGASGLLYSVSSFLVRSKALWMVVAGVNPDQAPAVEEEVSLQVGRLAEGRVEEADLESARRQVCGDLACVEDAPGRKISFLLGRLMGGHLETPADAAARLWAVTPAEVARAARAIALDTSFLLVPDGGGRNG